MTSISYRVGTLRAAGLEARWTKTWEGQPYIVVRDPAAATPHQREQWWVCDRAMVKLMEDQGIREGFNAATILGSMFSVKRRRV